MTKIEILECKQTGCSHFVGHLGYCSSDKPIFEFGWEFDGNNLYMKFGRNQMINDCVKCPQEDGQTVKPKTIELLNTFKLWHEISNNMVCAPSKGSDQPAIGVVWSEPLLVAWYSMTVKLLTKHHLEFLSLTGGCTGSSESTLVKMPHCWKSHVTAHL